LSLLWLAGGIGAVALGLYLASTATRRLRRNGVFGPNFWASLPQYPLYRLRALSPLGSALVGLALVVLGLLAFYAGVLGFFGSRFRLGSA
jgi:hypothetical protein